MSTNCQSQRPSPCVSDHEPQASPCCSFLTGVCRLIVASSWLRRIEDEGERRGERGAAMGLGRRMLWWPAHGIFMIDNRQSDIIMPRNRRCSIVAKILGKVVKMWRLVE